MQKELNQVKKTAVMCLIRQFVVCLFVRFKVGSSVSFVLSLLRSHLLVLGYHYKIHCLKHNLVVHIGVTTDTQACETQ